MTSPIIAFWLSLIIVVGNLERQHLARTVLRASTLQSGQTEDDLYLQLGRPLEVYSARKGWSFLAIGKRPRQWCYGTRIDLDHMFISDPVVSINPLPVKIRWFGYCDDDLVVDFDETGRVTRIDNPNLRHMVDHRYDGILNAIYTLYAVKEKMQQASQ